MRDRVNRFLSTLSGHAQFDVPYFLKGGLWLLLPLAIEYALRLLRSILFARLTGQSIYGEFGFINSVSGTAAILALPGINTALVETVARGNLGSLADAARARARWGVLSGLAVACVALYYACLQQGELAVALLVAGASLPPLSAFRVVQAYHNGRKRFDLVSSINVGIVLLNTLAILLILRLGKGIIWLVAFGSGSQLMLYLLYYVPAVRQTRGAPSDPGMISYGRSLTWAQAIGSAAFYMDSVILGFVVGFVDVAIYTVASIVPESVKGLMKTLTSLAMPKIAEQPDKRVYTPRTRRHLLTLLIINLAVVLLAIVAIPIVIPLVYGETYRESVHYAQLLMLSLALGWPSSFFSAALQARKRTQAIYRFNLIYGALQIGTLMVFAPLWGILGIVLSRIVTRWGATLYQWHAVTKI